MRYSRAVAGPMPTLFVRALMLKVGAGVPPHRRKDNQAFETGAVHEGTALEQSRHQRSAWPVHPRPRPGDPGRHRRRPRWTLPTSSFAEALTGALAAELEEDDSASPERRWPRSRSSTRTPIGPNALQALAEKFYKSPQFVPSEIHAALAALPFSLILTTCQDDLMADALQAAGKAPIVQRYHLRGDKRDNPEFPLSNSPQAPLVYHLFGDAQEPGSLVLSENDLLDFLIAIVSERPPLPNSLVRTLKRDGQSFLFVGFGITQWYLRVLLKVLVRSLELHRTGSKTIATEPLRGLSEVDREQTILFYQRGTPIELEDADTGAFLTELKERLDAEGGVAEQSAPTGPWPRVFISYAREDGDLASMTFDALQKANFEPWLDTDCAERRRAVGRAYPRRARRHRLHAGALQPGVVPQDGQLRQQGDLPGTRTRAQRPRPFSDSASHCRDRRRGPHR